MLLIKIHSNISKWKENSEPFWLLLDLAYFCYESARSSGNKKCEGSCKCEKKYDDLCRHKNYVNGAIFGCDKSHDNKWPHWMQRLNIKTCGHGMYYNKLHYNDYNGPPRVTGPWSDSLDDERDMEMISMGGPILYGGYVQTKVVILMNLGSDMVNLDLFLT